MSTSTDRLDYVRNVGPRLFLLSCLFLTGALQVGAVGAKTSNVSAIRKESATFLKNFPDAEAKSIGKHGTPTFVTGSLYDFRKAAIELNANAIRPGVDAILPLTGLSPENLQFKSQHADKVGNAHYKYKVVIDGQEVVGAAFIVHINKDGVIYCVNGSIPELGSVAVPKTPSVGRDAAKEIAKRANGVGPISLNEGKLVYVISARDHETYLAWVFDLQGQTLSKETISKRVFVDSLSGSVVDEQDLVMRVQYRKVYEPNGVATILDLQFPRTITYNAGTLRREEGQGPQSIYYVDQVYDFLGSSYGYYHGSFGYSPPESTYNLKTTVEAYYQSYWPPIYDPPVGTLIGYSATYEAIMLGFGGGYFTHASEGLDVVAHEYTHFVTNKTSGLVYSSESGGINESMSDVFGAMVEKYHAGSVSANTWKMGENVYVSDPNHDALRYINDPMADHNSPDNGGSFDYYPDVTSWSEVHWTSGIGNLAYYLVSQGGPHPRGKSPLTIPGLGISVAEQIWFDAQVSYVTPTTDYADFRAQTVQAASDLYGVNAATNVNLAWDVVGVPYSVTGASKPINASARAHVGTGNAVMVGGFVLSGSGSSKDFLIRAVGPELATYGVTGDLSDPYLTLTGIATNDNWGSAPNAVSALASQVGAFPLTNSSLDAAMVQTLGNGAYSLVVNGVAGATGEVVMDIYDSDATNNNHIVNFSTRAEIGSGQPVIMGFVITGELPRTLLLRAVGPTLGSYGLSGTLDDPKIAVTFGGTTLIENDNWGSASNSGDIARAASTVGAFALDNGSADAAILVTLPPGIYTALATSSSGNSGLTLVELYELP